MGASLFQEVRANKIKSVLTMFLFLIVILLLGAAIGAVYNSIWVSVIMAFLASGIYLLIAYYSGESMILSMTGAKEAEKKQYPHLINTVEGLAIAAGIPIPKVFVIDDSARNAFATGRDPKHAAVTVTTGLLDVLNREELEGVLAHEISHIKNFDIRFMMICVVCVGVIVFLSDMLLRSFLWGRSDDSKGNAQILFIVLGLVLAILAPLVGKLIQLAVSRRREYLADAHGVVLTRYPQGLANALKKIAKDPDPLVDHANRATAHLFISTPFRKKNSFVTNLFATHPPIEERIKRLEEM